MWPLYTSSMCYESHLNREIALLAADISIEYDIGMADSLVLGCTQFMGEPLVTLDNDFAWDSWSYNYSN